MTKGKKDPTKKKAPARRKPTKKVTTRARRGPSAITAAPMFQTEEEVLEAFGVMGITFSDKPTEKLFLKIAVMNHLNPIKREIHAVERKKKVVRWVEGKGEVTEYVKVLTPVTGYEVFIDRAEESGRLQYWYPVEDGKLDLKPEKDTYQVTIVIKRKDWPKEFRLTVKHSEVASDSPVWAKEPSHMTMKVGISRAFRLVFRDVLRGMPFSMEEEYTREEMRDVTPEKEMKEPQAKGLLAKANVAEVEAEELKQKVSAELRTAQEELQAIYSRCRDSKLYGKDRDGKDELKEMMAQAVSQKENLNSLRDLAVAWQIDLAERIEKAQRKGVEREPGVD